MNNLGFMKNERAWPDSAVGSHPGNSIHRARYCVQSYRRTASRRSFSVRLAILVAHLARRPILRSWSVFSFPDACFFLSPVPSISVSQLGFPHRGDSDFSHFPWIPVSCLRPSIFEGLISFLQLCFLLLRRFIFFCLASVFSSFIFRIHLFRIRLEICSGSLVPSVVSNTFSVLSRFSSGSNTFLCPNCISIDMCCHLDTHLVPIYFLYEMYLKSNVQLARYVSGSNTFFVCTKCISIFNCEVSYMVEMYRFW